MGGSCWRRSGRNEGTNKCSLRPSSSRVGSTAPLRCPRRPRCRAAAVVAQGVRERELSMDLKTKIMALIEEGWDRNRPPGGVGTTDSATIYTRLLAEGVDVPPGAMAQILEDLSAEGQITTGPQAFDREDKQL